MLVIDRMDANLREYLQNHDQLTWKERIKIAFLIVNALSWIHEENLIHRDDNKYFYKLILNFVTTQYIFCLYV
jgi:serine/threonine protein kinase